MNYYTMLWPNEYCSYVEKKGGVGKPLRFVWGGYNRQTDFRFYGVEEGDVIVPVRVQDGRLYVIGSMIVKECACTKKYLAAHPEYKHFIQHLCADQVLVGENGTPIRFDVVVPLSTLKSLRFRSKSSRKERAVKHIEDGKLKHAISVHGIYRLTENSAEALLNLLSK